MGKLSGKVIEATPEATSGSRVAIGKSLQDLRKLSGLTQKDLASKLKIGQTALSKLESRDDLHVSTLKSYVEALGAKLRIDAAFERTSSLALKMTNAFEASWGQDDQLVLPLIDDAKFRAQRDIVLSIKPQYSEQIILGKKKVELRRRFPTNVPSGTLAYIYSTSPERALIGSAEISDVKKTPVNDIWREYSSLACIRKTDFDNYFSGLEHGFVLELENPRLLNRAIGLTELRERFEFEPPQSFLYAKPLLREALKYEYSQAPN